MRLLAGRRLLGPMGGRSCLRRRRWLGCREEGPWLQSTGGDFVPMESPSPGLKSQPLSMPTRLWPKEATTPRQSGPSSAAALPAKIVLDIETPLFWTNNFTTAHGQCCR